MMSWCSSRILWKSFIFNSIYIVCYFILLLDHISDKILNFVVTFVTITGRFWLWYNTERLWRVTDVINLCFGCFLKILSQACSFILGILMWWIQSGGLNMCQFWCFVWKCCEGEAGFFSGLKMEESSWIIFVCGIALYVYYSLLIKIYSWHANLLKHDSLL